jgi:hypothetical protein
MLPDIKSTPRVLHLHIGWIILPYQPNAMQLIRSTQALLFLLPFTTLAQAPPALEWQRNLGGSGSDFANSVEQTADGGYIFCGTTFSNNGDVSGDHGQADIWVVKLDASGSLLWQRCLGGTDFDLGIAAHQLIDGSYLVVGNSSSNNGDVSGNHGEGDIWLAHLDASGALIWQRCYGGSLADAAEDLKVTPDGGYVIVGESYSTEGDLTSNAGAGDYWILKLDTEGEIEWQRSYGGNGGDGASSIALTSDGGYAVNGYTESNNGDVSGSHGSKDYWVLKLNGQGMLQWQRPCGGSNDDWGRAIAEMSNGDIMAGGYSMSQDGDVSPGIQIQDIWTVRISSTGNVIEDRSYGGSSLDFASSILDMPDDGVIICGNSQSLDGDLSGNQGGRDGWLFRTNAQGEMLWNLTMGGTQTDTWATIRRTNDGGYILAGASESSNGDLPGNNGYSDVWVVKLGLDPVSVHELQDMPLIRVYPNPSKEHIQVDLPLSMRNAYWQLHDAQGKVFGQGQVLGTSQSIAISHLAPGAYTIELETMGDRQSVVVVKE